MKIYKSSQELPDPSKEGGVIYIVSQYADGPTKIGISTEVRKRIKSLETSIGHRFGCIGVSDDCKNYAEIEAALHGQFKKRRGVGEWFDMPFMDGYIAAVESDFQLVDWDAYWAHLLKVAENARPPDDVGLSS